MTRKKQRVRFFPFRGRVVPEFNDVNIRQLILRPYRIIYRVEEPIRQVSVARFWHTARGFLE
ncbi:MAG: type II toxin-antitoxin system RelE/ParE family toxin [Microcystaceae cyanobacterium]